MRKERRHLAAQVSKSHYELRFCYETVTKDQAMHMPSLILKTQRCLDGLKIIEDGILWPRSERREQVRIVTTDLKDPVAVQFINARGQAGLVQFMSRYSAGSTALDDEREVTAIDDVASIQDIFLQRVADAGGANQLEALLSISSPLVKVRADFHLRDGEAQMLLYCNDLLDLMRMEIAMVALEGAKLVTCEHCRNYFLTGPYTGRRIHTIHCSDKCRVAAMRARKKGESNVDP
jgi:hypothetical protein